MPKRTIAVQFYIDSVGTFHGRGEEVDFSDEEAKRADALGATEEAPKSSDSGEFDESFSKDDLVAYAKDRGLDSSGSKAALIERLNNA